MITNEFTNLISQQAGDVLNPGLLETNLASRGKRLGGILIDGLISVMILLSILLVTSGQEQILSGQQMTAGQQAAFFVIGWVVFLIWNGYLLSSKGQTIGKLVVKTKIVDRHGNVPHFGKLFLLRYFLPGLVAQIPVVGGLIAMADILFIFGKENRCLHDHLAGTWVINE